MFKRNAIALACGALVLLGLSPASQAFFSPPSPPSVVPATEMITWPGQFKTLGADVSRLHKIDFDECSTDNPIFLVLFIIPNSAAGGLQLRSNGCGIVDVEALPDGVSEIRLEVGCAEGGGGYTTYASYDGSVTDANGRILPSGGDVDAYADCLPVTDYPGFRVVFEYD